MDQTESGRRAVRRAVELPCEVVSRYVDQPLLYWATDLSPFGMWLETKFPMQAGERLVVCFQPPIWWRARELMVFAEVVRASSGRDNARGMAVEFNDLNVHERRTLRGWLRGRPPPLPRRRKRSGESWRPLPRPRFTLH